MPVSHHDSYVTYAALTESLIVVPERRVMPVQHSDTQILRGNIGSLTLQPGLQVHYADTEELQDLTIVNECKPQLILSVFLEGTIKATIGTSPIPMPVRNPETGLWQPILTLRAQSIPHSFSRHGRRGDRLRKIVISMSMDWLRELAGIGSDVVATDIAPILDYAKQDLAIQSWSPTAQIIAACEQILFAPSEPKFFHKLYVESRVLALIGEAFSQFCNSKTAVSSPRPRDIDRLKQIDQYLVSTYGQTVSLGDLANHVGLSANALRHLTMGARGISPGKYIRQFRLEQAKQAMEADGASIAEAAYLAGYSSSANFTTAFKRCFGLSPGALSRG